MNTSPWKVMLAIDGSPSALAASCLVRDLPLPPESCIDIVSVLIPRNAAEQFPALDKILKQTQAQLQSRGSQVNSELLTGNPAEELIEYAEQTHPDLIVLGAKGLRGTLGILLGGVAQQVVEYAPAPVLVVRPPYKGIRRILLVVDASLQSQQATQYLARFPLPKEVDIRVLHALPPLYSSRQLSHTWPDEAIDLSLTHQEEDLLKQQAEAEEWEGQELLNKATATLEASGKPAQTVLTRGDAATSILEFCQREAIDWVVAGSRGLSRIRGILLGSVSRKLVHYASNSVLIVRGS